MVASIRQSIFSELADFLVSQPTLEVIAAYRVSPNIQAHIDDLLEKNNEDHLSATERIELEKNLAVSDVIDLMKAKAKLKLTNSSR